MAARNFKPKASSNIEEQIPVTPAESENEVEVASAPDVQETSVVETAEAPESEVKETTPAVTFEDKSTKNPIEKNVKIRTRANHSCCIGGVRYHFEKGKLTNVPESVKAILLQADLLMPL